MRGIVFICALISVIVPSLAFSAGQDEASPGCVQSVFGTDRAAVIKACTMALQQSGLSDETRAGLLKLRAWAQYQSQNIDAAVRDLDAALTITPKDLALLVRRGMAAIHKREFDPRPVEPAKLLTAALYAKQALSIDPNYWGAYDLLGMTGTAGGSLEIAKAAFDRAIELRPNDAFVHTHRLYFCKHFYLFDEGLKELEALSRLPDRELDTTPVTIHNKEMSVRTMIRLERASVLERMGRFEEAEKAYADWVNVEPGAISYAWSADFHFRRTKFEVTQAELDKSFSYDSKFWYPHNTQGNLYFYTNQHERAVASFTLAISDFPETGMNYWGRALALRALQRNDEATADGLKAIEDPELQLRIIKRVTKSGYLKINASTADQLAALRDAVRACMLDE